jgi:capsid portal protein
MPRRRRKREERPVEALTRKRVLAKALELTGNVVDEPTAISAIESTEEMFGQQNAVTPDYDPESLLAFIELSPHLSPNIAAYVQNIDGYGYQRALAESWMEDLESEEAADAVRQALVIEAWVDSEEAALAQAEEKADLAEQLDQLTAKLDDAKAKKRTAKTIAKWQAKVDAIKQQLDELEPEPEPESMPDTEDATAADEEEVPDEAVQAKLDEIDMQIRREGFLFDSFFEHCVSTMSFTKLRRIVRQDIESHGWGCIEMERDGYDRLKRLSYVPAYTVRPLNDPGDLIEVIEADPVTPLSEDREITVRRRFPIYVQIVQERKVYFSSPGDPRIVSRTTGKTYESIREMRKKDNEGPSAQPANELLWIAQHSPKTPCPPPRWIGNLLQVLGGREADETNYFYLRDNAIPYGLLFVSGGIIPNDIIERVESRLASEMRGSEGAGKILVVQAKPMGKASSDGRTMLPELEFQSLRDAHEEDSLFTKYDERGADRIGASFRLSPILRGYTPSTLNRATAMAALQFAEQQVFQPERADFDWIVNKYLLPELGIKYTRFVSNSPPTRSVEDVVEIIKAAAPQGGILPYEIRQLLSDLLNRPLAKVQEEWAQQPMVMTLAGLAPGGAPNTPPGEEDVVGEMTDLVKRLANIEARVRNVVAEELAAFGMDVDVSLVDRPETFGDGEADGG